MSGSSTIQRLYLGEERPDVAAYLRDPDTIVSGFATSVDTACLKADAIDVVAVLGRGRSARIGRLGLTHSWHSGRHPAEASVVSVIIAGSSGKPALAASVETCLQQRHPHVETLVVAPETDTEMLAWLARRFPSVRHVAASGAAAAARRAGIRASNGEFLIFLRAGDRLTPDALAENMALLRSNPSWAFVSGADLAKGAGRKGRFPLCGTMFRRAALRVAARADIRALDEQGVDPREPLLSFPHGTCDRPIVMSGATASGRARAYPLPLLRRLFSAARW